MLIAHAVGPHGRIKRAYVCRGARGRYANLGAEGDPLFDLALIVVPAHQEIPARHEEDGQPSSGNRPGRTHALTAIPSGW
jgi:hypothetical protein